MTYYYVQNVFPPHKALQNVLCSFNIIYTLTYKAQEYVNMYTYEQLCDLFVLMLFT